jgi:hypothetical protein
MRRQRQAVRGRAEQLSSAARRDAHFGWAGSWWAANALCSLRPMRHLARHRPRRRGVLVAAVFAVAAVLAPTGLPTGLSAGLAPTSAVFGAAPVLAQTPSGKSATEPASRGEKDVGPGSSKEDNRRQFPLDLQQPHDILGLGILLAAGLGAALALGNAVKVLRGERPRATGKWRPR